MLCMGTRYVWKKIVGGPEIAGTWPKTREVLGERRSRASEVLCESHAVIGELHIKLHLRQRYRERLNFRALESVSRFGNAGADQHASRVPRFMHLELKELGRLQLRRTARGTNLLHSLSCASQRSTASTISHWCGASKPRCIQLCDGIAGKRVARSHRRRHPSWKLSCSL